jgi:tetratricopeptide (TPR) repeat protein
LEILYGVAGIAMKCFNKKIRVQINYKITLLAGLFILISCSDKTDVNLSEDKIINLANTYYNSELYTAAIAEYKELLANYDIDRNRQANIYYQIATIYFERVHDYEKALENYLRIKYIYPESSLQAEVGKQIVNCLERLERSQDAQRVLDREAALKPDEVEESRPGEVIAKIGNKKITQGDLEFEIKHMPPYLQTQLSSKSKKIEFLRQYIAEELLFDSAKRKNLDKDKEIIEGTYRAKNGLMAQKILREEIQKQVEINQADVELYYKANKEKYAEKDDAGKITREKSFQECAEQVAQDLFLERQQEAYQQLIERLMKAENVTIYEKKIN